MDPTLSDIETFARTAGEILRRGYGKKIQVERKGIIDLVTEIDRESDSYLVKAIRERFPRHQIITEESGVMAGEAGQTWYIDPLDGTINYAHGVPIFSVSIAYAEKGQVVLGGVYDPMHDEYYYAQRGVGAWLNGTALRVSGRTALDHSLLVTGFPYDIRTDPENNLDHYADLTLRSLGVRRLGSAAIDLAYVAAGRFDGFWEVRIKSWDIAAGSLLVQEAGGRVTDVHGGPNFLSPSPSILATNGQIHPEMLAALWGSGR
jgi:myo-inositol-1(or 4)-monophosphatase